LTEMETQEYTGLIEFGVPGASKTYVATALAATYDIPLIVMSIPDIMEKFVGSSNENFNKALAMIRAVSQGKAFFIGTCNALANIGGPLRRRFCYGEWMFDLPTNEERELIWPIHLTGYDLNLKSKRPDDDGWTGAEIRNCCRMAHEMGIDLIRASEYISPVARTMAHEIKAMREYASGRFKSAAVPGVYSYQSDTQNTAATVPPATGKRRLNIGGGGSGVN